MLVKLLKKDLKVNMRWMWILFVATLAVAGIARGCKELGENIAFFKILGIFFDSVFYALAVNVILQPFLRNFLNFTKSLYSDESYLTHTLPVTKNQIVNSKILTALIELVLGFACLIASLLIMFASPTFLDTLKLLLSTLITGNFSIIAVIVLFVVLVFVEFFMFISIIYLSVVIAYREKEKRLLKTFLLTAAMAFAAIFVLGATMIVVLTINGVDLSNPIMLLSSKTFFSVILTGIVVYTLASTLFYFLTKHALNKGVNID